MAATSKRAVIEKRDHELRRKEFAREDLLKQVNDDAVFLSNLHCDDKFENNRRLRIHRVMEEELQTHSLLAEKLRKKEDSEYKRQKEEELVKMIESKRLEQMREEKLRQSIRQNSVELRELEKKLSNAYMNKERSLQIEERIMIEKQERGKEQALITIMNKNLEAANKLELQKEREQYVESRDYKRQLQNQLQDHELRKLQEFELFLRDKAMIDAIVAKINAEDEEEAQTRLSKQRETKQYIEDYIKERKLWKQSEKQRQDEENKKIEEHARQQRQREEELLLKKLNTNEERDIIYDRLAAEVARQEKEKSELEKLRVELYQEEEEERARMRDQQLFESRIRKRLEMIDSYQMQVREKQQRTQREHEEEETFRNKMMQKFAEDERIEQLNAQKRRMKQLEHKKAVDELCGERRKLFRENYSREIEEQKRQEELEHYRQEVIEQERQRLLREHASQLLGYLPKGVFRSQQDLDLFDEQFKRKFGELSFNQN